jgi:thioredoxin-dependent peroxiredoxin
MSFKKAENFILKDQWGEDFELYKNLDQYVLLVFYPKDNSRVCSVQLDNYQQNIKEFEETGIKPVGINIESTGSHKSFCGNINIQFPLLSDPDKKVSRSFNALNFLSINKRKLVLISPSREIVYERDIPFYKYDNTRKIVEDLRRKQII